MSRAWQAGDLVEITGDIRTGEWVWVLDVVDTDPETGCEIAPPLIMDSKGYTFETEECTLLAAADADLWEALRGLPRGFRLGGHSPERIGIELAENIRAEYCEPPIGPQFYLRTCHCEYTDTAPLKQAIQRFEALQQYISQHREVRNGNV